MHSYVSSNPNFALPLVALHVNQELLDLTLPLFLLTFVRRIPHGHTFPHDVYLIILIVFWRQKQSRIIFLLEMEE
jgi:hypothetical protein